MSRGLDAWVTLLMCVSNEAATLLHLDQGVSNSIYPGAAGGRVWVRLGRIRYSTIEDPIFSNVIINSLLTWMGSSEHKRLFWTWTVILLFCSADVTSTECLSILGEGTLLCGSSWGFFHLYSHFFSTWHIFEWVLLNMNCPEHKWNLHVPFMSFESFY